jgi:hypothetical protein
MATRKRKALTALAAFLAFGLSQVYVQAGLPNSTPGPAPQQAITATLRSKQPVKINGNDAGNGTTLLTGTTIETEDQVSAVIDLGAAGTVEVGPNSKIELTWDANGNVHVKLVRGCARTNKTANAIGEADVSTDTVTDATNPNKKQAGGCLLPNGQLGSFPSGLSGLELTGLVVIPTVVVTTIIVARGGNSSPSD